MTNDKMVAVVDGIRKAKTVKEGLLREQTALRTLLEEAKTRDDNVLIDEALALLRDINSEAAITEGTTASTEPAPTVDPSTFPQPDTSV